MRTMLGETSDLETDRKVKKNVFTIVQNDMVLSNISIGDRIVDTKVA